MVSEIMESKGNMSRPITHDRVLVNLAVDVLHVSAGVLRVLVVCSITGSATVYKAYSSPGVVKNSLGQEPILPPRPPRGRQVLYMLCRVPTAGHG